MSVQQFQSPGEVVYRERLLRKVHVRGVSPAACVELLLLSLLAQQNFPGFRLDGFLFAGLRLRPGLKRLVPFNSCLTPANRRQH